MWLLMLLKQWDDLAIETDRGHRIKITGYCMPMGPDGGKIPATAFMPVFSTYEHAEAARGDTHAPIYEVAQVPPPGSEPGEFEDFNPHDDPEDPQWI